MECVTFYSKLKFLIIKDWKCNIVKKSTLFEYHVKRYKIYHLNIESSKIPYLTNTRGNTKSFSTEVNFRKYIRKLMNVDFLTSDRL